MKLLEWLWSLLPDECEVNNCSRKGVRGNENIVHGMVMCDYCHAAEMTRQRENSHWLMLQDEGKE